MNSIIINDCRDSNAAGRQEIRSAHLFGRAPIFIGVKDELEAAGNLIDALDALDGNSGLVLINVAPRHAGDKRWENGVPFGYFYFGKTLIVTTMSESILSLAKKFELSGAISVLNTETATAQMIRDGFIPPDLKNQIAESQFRSFDFLPRLAAYLAQTGKELGQKTDLASFPDAPKTVWLIDNFGNCKTTLLPEDVSFSTEKTLTAKFGKLNCYSKLKDVPDNEAALIIGSSGLGEKRFLEIVIQGQNAAEYFDLSVGHTLLI